MESARFINSLQQSLPGPVLSYTTCMSNGLYTFGDLSLIIIYFPATVGAAAGAAASAAGVCFCCRLNLGVHRESSNAFFFTSIGF